jgi:4-amino-4-deoxy-L-arabinose transferase-like glycosyltransferase/Tfp pilus assembly protein PilF
MDMKYHNDWARAIASGQSFIEGPFFRAPLYPYIIGALYYIFGVGDWVVRIFQLILGSLSVSLVYMIGTRSFSNFTGIIAGLLCAIYGPLIFFGGQLLIPTTIIFLNLLAFYFLIFAFDSGEPAHYIIAGLCFGLSAIARPTILLFVVVAMAWLLWRRIRQRRGTSYLNVGLIVVGLIVPIVPVTYYNYAHSGEFTLIGTYGGLNAYIGNNENADGVSAQLPGARRDWWGMMEDAQIIAEQDVGHELTPGEQSSYWLSRATDEIISDPTRFFELLGRKALLLAGGLELSNNFDLYFFAHQTSLMRVLMPRDPIPIPWGVVFPFALCGIVLVSRWSRPNWLLLLFAITYSLSIILFFVTARYRLPLAPILLLFAAYTVDTLVNRRAKIKLTRWIIAAVVLVAGLGVANVDFLGLDKRDDAQAYYTLATIYGDEGNSTLQERYYRKAIAEDTTLSEAYNNLGLMLASQGRFDDALQVLSEGLDRMRYDAILQYNTGYVAMKAGRLDLAKIMFQAVLENIPDDLQSANNLGLTFMQLQQYDSARFVYYRELTFDSGQAIIWYGLGQANLLDGRPSEARMDFDRTLSLDSTFAKAHYALGLAWLRTGDVDSAAGHLKMFLDTNPPEADLAADSRRILDSLGIDH